MTAAQNILNMGSDLLREQFPETEPIWLIPPADLSAPVLVLASVDMLRVGRESGAGVTTRRTVDAQIMINRAANPVLVGILAAHQLKTIPEVDWKCEFRGITVSVANSNSDSTSLWFNAGTLQ